MKKGVSLLAFVAIYFLLTSCITEQVKARSGILIRPGDEMVPVLVQGHVMGEDGDEDSTKATYPLPDVKISVSRASGKEGISIIAMSDNRGFFSISPDYVSKNDPKKHSYLVTFKKMGHQTLERVLHLPSSEASRLDVLLKRAK